MIFNSYCNINLKPRGKQSQNYYKPSLKANNILSQKLQNSFSTTKFKQSNYINYTFSDKNKYNHKNKSTKNFHKQLNSTFNNKHRLIIVNDYLNKLQKSTNWANSLKFSKENSISINYNSSKNFFNNTNSRNFIGQEINFDNNYYNEEITNKDNISKISNNNSLKTFLNDNNGQRQSKNEPNEPYDYIDIYKEKSMKFNEELKNLLKDKNLSKNKLHMAINTSMPIFKRINILKQAKSSINRIKKGIMNSSSSSFKTFLDENNISKYNNYSLEKDKNNNEIKYYFNKDYYYKNDISNKKPIIIKYLPKPKLTVPKFININSIKVL